MRLCGTRRNCQTVREENDERRPARIGRLQASASVPCTFYLQSNGELAHGEEDQRGAES